METSASMLVDSTAVNLDTEIPPRRKPKRVLHFSDGTLEEYSDDDELHDADEDDAAAKNNRQLKKESPKTTAVAEKKSPQHMRWGEYLLHLTMTFGVRSLNFCDYLGEKFAWALGITTPKYGYAIEEREWQKKEEREEKEREERERKARAKRNAVEPLDGGGGGGRGTGVGDDAAVYSVGDGLHLGTDSEILSSENQKF